jgi:hypothetical protein
MSFAIKLDYSIFWAVLIMFIVGLLKASEVVARHRECLRPAKIALRGACIPI